MKEVGYKKLILYKRMMELVLLVYELTGKISDSEKFGLISQMRRAAVSVVSNFAEGYLRRSKREKLLYLERGTGSLYELEAQGEICFRLTFWDELQYQAFTDKLAEVAYLLHRYSGALKA